MAGDAVALCLAAGAAVLGLEAAPSAATVSLTGLFGVLVLALRQARRPPTRKLSRSALEAVTEIVGIVSLAAMLTIATASIAGVDRPVPTVVRLWLWSLLMLGVARVALASLERRGRGAGARAEPTLIVGAGIVGRQVARRLEDSREYGLTPVGFLDADPMPCSGPHPGPPTPLLGGLSDLARAVETTGAQRVILAFSSSPDHVLVELVRECEQLGLEVSLVPRLYEALGSRATIDHVGGLPLLTLRAVNPRGKRFAVKHALDHLIATLAIAALGPAMLAIALAVRLTSAGPVLFRQRRVGRDGRIFDVYKFRTMVTSPEERTYVPSSGMAPGGVEGADRRTAVGRLLRATSLDELPQLLNVARGEMSLVGPRPERPEFVERFGSEVHRYGERHRVKSGITGWAQVHGLRGQTSIADRVELDNHYIRNWSVGLDLKILALTVAEVARLRDAG